MPQLLFWNVNGIVQTSNTVGDVVSIVEMRIIVNSTQYLIAIRKKIGKD